MESSGTGKLWNVMEQESYGSYEKFWNRKVMESYEQLWKVMEQESYGKLWNSEE